MRRVENYDTWLGSATEVPKLLLTFDPGAIMTPSTISWCHDHIAALEVEHLGAGIHFVPEDNGPAIGIAIANWRERLGLVKEPVQVAGPADQPDPTIEENR